MLLSQGIGYFILHKSFMKALCTIYSPLSILDSPLLLLPLISSMRQELSIFAKRFSQSPVRAPGEAAEVSQAGDKT